MGTQAFRIWSFTSGLIPTSVEYIGLALEVKRDGVTVRKRNGDLVADDHIPSRILHGQEYKDSGYVVTDAPGRQMKPDRLTRSWYRACDKAKVPRIQLHDARHTCATLMHLDGVPIVVIAAWLGRVDAGLTMRTYAHSQNDALKLAAASLK